MIFCDVCNVCVHQVRCVVGVPSVGMFVCDAVARVRHVMEFKLFPMVVGCAGRVCKTFNIRSVCCAQTKEEH